MPKDYYPAFYEVYVEQYFYSKYGRSYTSENVIKRGLSEDEAKELVVSLRPTCKGDRYVGSRKMVDILAK